MNLRSSKTDKRYLSDQDKADLRGATARQNREERRVKAKRGALAYQRNKPMRTTERAPGTGGFSAGIGIQQQRLRELGDEKRRSESFRPEDPR